MKVSLFIFSIYLFTSCQVKEVEPLIFENYFFGEGNYSLKVEDFYGNYKIWDTGNTPLLDTDNYSKEPYYGEHPNQFSFSYANNQYYIEYPLYASRGNIYPTTGFFIKKTNLRLNDFEILFTNKYENNGQGIQTLVVAKGILNKNTRTIDLKIEYYNGQNFNRPEYNISTGPDIVKNFTYKFSSKLQ
jgi:hypothetical protein